MRSSLKPIRARVERLLAEQQRRQGSGLAGLVSALQAARTQKPKKNWDNWTDEQIRAHGRRLRAMLRDAGHPFFQ